MLFLCFPFAEAVAEPPEPKEDKPKSVIAINAAKQYDQATKSAKELYATQLAEAKNAYLAELDQAIKVAMREEDLDEANRLNASKSRIAELSESVAGDAAEIASDVSPSIDGIDLKGGGSVSLLRLPISYARVGFDGFSAGGHEATGQQMKRILAGRQTEDYLIAHADSLLIYNVPPGSKRFTAIGTTWAPDDPRTTRFKFQITTEDGMVLISTRELSTFPKFSIPIDVEIPKGCKRLLFETLSDSPHGMQWSVWVQPKFWGESKKAKK